MKLFKYIILFVLLLSTGSAAQILPRSNSIEEIYESGQKRTYLFSLDEIEFGKLEIEYKGKARLEGLPGHLFEEHLNLDFKPLGQEYSIKIDNRHYVDNENRYIGDDMAVYTNNQFQKLFFKKDNQLLSGYMIRDNQEEELSLPQREIFSSLDNNLINQIELFLSFQNLVVGDTIRDTIFIPQTLLMAPVTVAIDKPEWIRYGELSDSAFVCHFIEPTDMVAYFTKTKKLIRIDQETQKIQIILSETAFDRVARKKKAFALSDFLSRLPLYLVYLIFGGLFALPLARRYYKEFPLYVILVLGALTYLIISATLYPLQKWYSIGYIMPGLRSGNSLYFLTILPALFSGLIQEFIKIIPIIIFFLWRRPKQLYSIALGLACGIGFGIYEASSITGPAFQSGTFGIFSWNVLERLAVILFHAVSGAAFGYGINRGFKHLLYIWPIIALIHSFSDYLIVFVQKATIDIGLLVIIKIIIDLLLLLSVYIMVKSARR